MAPRNNGCRRMIAEHFVWQETAAGAVLLDTREGRYYELNRTATAMFCYLATNESDADIVADIVRRFEIGHADARRDLAQLKSRLEQMGALSVERDSAVTAS